MGSSVVDSKRRTLGPARESIQGQAKERAVRARRGNMLLLLIGVDACANAHARPHLDTSSTAEDVP